MLQKYFDFNKSCSHTHFSLYLESLDLGTLDKKQLKDEEIKKHIEKQITKTKLPSTISLR